jgi:hypothetical protein
MWSSALRVVDLHPATRVWDSRLECLVESCRSGRTVRRRGRYLNERKERVDEGAGVFDGGELGESKAL